MGGVYGRPGGRGAGVLVLLFLLNYWRILALALLIASLTATAGFYKWRAEVWEGRYEDFRVEVRAAGLAAESAARAKEMADKKAKEIADGKWKKSVAALRADVKRLRDERASRSYLSEAPSGAGSTGTTCLARPDAERAIRDFVEETGRLIEEGDEARAGLDAAREWAVILAPR